MYLKKLYLQINLILYFLLRYMFYASPQYVIANFISYYKKLMFPYCYFPGYFLGHMTPLYCHPQ